MLALQQFVTHRDQLPVETFPWGNIQWIANSQLLPAGQQTLGICQINPGHANALHYHPNCEELLYVVQGTGRHSFDDQWIELRPGTTIRVPTGVKHNLINEGREVMITWISFSSGERQTVFLE